LDFVTLRETPFGHSFHSPPNHLDGEGIISVTALFGQLDLIEVGVIDPHVGERTLIVRSRHEGDEQGLGFLTVTDPKGVMLSLRIRDRELGVTGGEELD
jgi:hypothetical protein